MTFKKGQQVWWDDPIHEKSGEYDVLAVDHTRNMVRIGCGEETFETPPEHLTLTCPVSEEDRQRLDKMKRHYRALEKDSLEMMRDIVSRFDDGEFSVEGYSVQVCDEDHDPCCVYGFAVDDGELYAELDYESGDLRRVPVKDLHAGVLFEAFRMLVENL